MGVTWIPSDFEELSGGYLEVGMYRVEGVKFSINGYSEKVTPVTP